MISKFTMVKNLNFAPAISTWLKILKISSFYRFQIYVEQSQEIRILTKNFNLAKTLTLA